MARRLDSATLEQLNREKPMSWYGLVTFCAIYALAVATPGPGVAAAIARGLSQGSAGAWAFIGGFIVGDLTWFFAAAWGLSALAQTAHTAFVAVKYAGALYLLYLAYRLWSMPAQPLAVGAAPPPAQKSLPVFLGSLSLTLGNPKAMIFYLALLPSVVRLETLDWRGQLEIAAAILVIVSTILGVYVFAAARSRGFFRNPRAVKIVNRGSGTLMAAAAVAVASR
jgi:threonine/homoserine/homoserine lactone efflux protein